MSLLKIIVVVSTTFFFATSATAFNWSEFQAKNWKEYYDELDKRDVDGLFPSGGDARSDAKLCTTLGGGELTPGCENLCIHLYATMQAYLVLGADGQLPDGFNDGDAIVGPLRAANTACKDEITFNP